MLRQGKQIRFTREFSSEFCAIDGEPSVSPGGRQILVEVKAFLSSGFFSTNGRKPGHAFQDTVGGIPLRGRIPMRE